MAIARVSPHAVLLADDRVLVIGGQGEEFNGESTTTELWDPEVGAWKTVGSLNKPRSFFATVALQDGRALVIGGLNDIEQSFSSTYVFDSGTETWTKVGLLGTARTSPSAAVLPDGRVLVAGGFFYVKPTAGAAERPGIMLAAYRPAAGASKLPLADVEPQNIGSAMATAELFEPGTGAWSPTGSLIYARVGAKTVTLSDGRVLIVGSTTGAEGGVAVDPGAFESAEVYDPQTGRFSLVGELPDINRAALEEQGAPNANPVPESSPEISDVGTLVALDDGGAVLIGHAAFWKHAGEITRSFRFDVGSRSWTEIGQTYIDIGEPSPVHLTVPGAPNLLFAMAARLSDGGVLVLEGVPYDSTGLVRRYDLATNTWSMFPSVSEPRARGAILPLADGSVLVIGGVSGAGDVVTPVATSTRFIPGP